MYVLAALHFNCTLALIKCPEYRIEYIEAKTYIWK